MISFIEKHQRLIVLSLIGALLMIIAIVLLEHDIELSGGLILSSTLFIFVYSLCSFIFLRKKTQEFKGRFFQIEKLSTTGFIILLLVFAAVESIEKTPVFSVIFIELIIILLIYFYLTFRKEANPDREQIKSKRPDVAIWVYWLFFIGNGLLIVVSEDQFADKEQFGIAVLTYFSILIIFIIYWLFKQIRTIIELKNEQKRTELRHLQSQVNPHFFFNMLNNLYGWVEKDAKKAQEMILGLSDMMRYSIYDGQQDFVTLEQERDYLKNYIDLHKNRYQKKTDVVFHEDIEQTGIEVKPLLLIILLENAFKHGVEKLRGNAYIHIKLNASKTGIKFSVENNFDPEIENKNKGIGLQNLRRRLELTYPNKHELTITTKEDIYKTNLTIAL